MTTQRSPDVRALQALLDGGVTDPATILAAIPGPVLIPDDGGEHDCRCGAGSYRVWSSGWVPPLVVDFEGVPVLFCTGCGVELEAAT